MSVSPVSSCSDSELTGDAASVASRFTLASLQAASGNEADREQAKSTFLQIINEVPGNLGAWVNLGILLFETGYTSAAATAFSAAASYHPMDATNGHGINGTLDNETRMPIHLTQTLMEQLAIRLNCQKTAAKSLVISRRERGTRIATRVSR